MADSPSSDNGDVKIEQNDSIPPCSSPPPPRPKLVDYEIDDNPPWYMCLLFGLQHYLLMIGSIIGAPLLLAVPMCIEDAGSGIADDVAKAELIATLLFVSGVITFLQCTFGVRLPIVQGGSAAFIVPILGIFRSMDSNCPTLISSGSNLTEFLSNNPSITESSVMVAGSEAHKEIWQTRLRAIQGALMVASVLQVIVGFSGLVGIIVRFIGPLVIAPVLLLVGVPLFSMIGEQAGSQWGVAMLTVGLLCLFSEVLKNTKIPCFLFKRGDGCARMGGTPIFRLFPIFLAMTCAYIVSVILTYTNVFPNDPANPLYRARTDIRSNVLVKAPWVQFSYPGKWGMPIVTMAGVIGMLGSVIASLLESIGDYYSCARLSGAPTPTSAAMNRGVFIEGVGSVIAGACGSVVGTTSYSGNIAAISITKVASRRAFQAGALIMIVLGTISKFCAVFVTIPQPVLGGTYIYGFGLVAAVGLSNLQFVDLNSSRNLTVLALSIMLGMSVPDWVQNNPDAINTGSVIADDVLRVLLTTNMFIGGSVAFLIDNLLPGTRKERGLQAWSTQVEQDFDGKCKESSVYDLPLFNKQITSVWLTRYVPICPNFLSKNQGDSASNSADKSQMTKL